MQGKKNGESCYISEIYVASTIITTTSTSTTTAVAAAATTTTTTTTTTTSILLRTYTRYGGTTVFPRGSTGRSRDTSNTRKFEYGRM